MRPVSRSVALISVLFGTLVLILISLLLVTASHSSSKPNLVPIPLLSDDGAVVFSDDFSTDPSISGQWVVHRANDDLDREGYWDSTKQIFNLTRTTRGPSFWQKDTWNAVAMFANYELTATRWEARFRYKVGGGSGADGFVFMFYKDKGLYSHGRPAIGACLGFHVNKRLKPEPCSNHRDSLGYGVEFDGWKDGGRSAPHIALIHDRVDRHLRRTSDSRAEDNIWHDALVQFDNGHIVVNIDGSPIIDYVTSYPDYTYSGVGFSASTGGATNNHIIDNFVLTVDRTTIPTPTATSIPPQEPVIVYRALDEPDLDGDLSEWGAIPAIALNADTASQILGQVPTAEDASATLRAAWSPGVLYLAIEVRDDAVLNDSSDIWNDDGVEIGIDTDNNGEKSVPPDHQYIFASDGRLRDFGTKTLSFPHGVQETADGWTLEASIYIWSVISAGRTLGFNWALTDDDDGADTVESWLVWRGTHTNQPASDWGRLLFSKDAFIVWSTPTTTETLTPTTIPTGTPTPTPTVTETLTSTPTILPTSTPDDTPGATSTPVDTPTVTPPAPPTMRPVYLPMISM